MKIAILITAFLLSFGAVAQKEVMTNTSVVQMVKGGFSPQMIIKIIQHGHTNFDTSANALMELKANSVPEDVINIMIDPKASAFANPKTTNDKTDEDSGIYFEIDGKKQKLDPSPIVAAKAKSFGNTLANNLTGGLSKKQARLIVEGEHSSTQLKNARPQFVFIFEKQEAGLNNRADEKKGFWGAIDRAADATVNYSVGSTGTASNPKDFVLSKMLNQRDKNTRELLTAGETVFDYGGGLDPSLLVDFKYEWIKGNTYLITFSNDLPVGEYCFFYANARATQQSTKKLKLIAFDFSIISNQ